MKKKFIWVLLILMILCGAGIYYYSCGEKVEVVAAKQGTISETVEESGYTRASESYELQAPSSGRILEIMISNGQKIKANEVAVQMQDLSLEANLAEVNQSAAEGEAAIQEARINLDTAKLDLDDARKNLDKKSSLFNAQAISQTEYDNAVTAVKKCEQSVDLLQSRIASGLEQLAAYRNEQNSLKQKCDELAVRSPINGTVLNLPIKKGQLVESGTTLLIIGTPNRLEAYAEILSNEVVKVKTGQTARISFAGSQDQSLQGRVTEVYPQAGEKLSALNVLERRVPVVVTLDENGPLQPGYEVKVTIDCAARQKTLVIPREALISGAGGENQVRIANSGRVETRAVTIGLKNQLQVEILKGLKIGDLVIRDGSLQIDDGSRVKVIR
ncbi:MAG: efflux RND transporter periplasmic adaptor subunit [Syntrophomonas sp.]